MGENDLFTEMVAVDKNLSLGVSFGYHDNDSVFQAHGQLNLSELFLDKLAVALDDYIVVGVHISNEDKSTVIEFIEGSFEFAEEG